MTEKVVHTADGPIRLVISQKYTLTSLLDLKEEQIQPFLDLFRVKTEGPQGVSDLIKILHNNDLLVRENILEHRQIWDWLSKPISEIQKTMTEKGIWFPGMTKYLAVKVLLMSHTLVEQNIPSPSPIPSPALTEPLDYREFITTGSHHETLPIRDFQIYEKRSNLRSLLLKNHFGNNPMIKSFSSYHLRILYEYYDEHTFNHELSQMIQHQKRRIRFDTNLTSKTKAGEHSYDSKTKTHTIKISPHLIGQLFTKGETNIKSNGLVITDRLSGLLSVFEHEITHLYCSLKGYTRKIKQGQGKMYYGPHGKLFQELVFRFFGHTDFRHSFNHGEATEQLNKVDCQVGICVYFDSNKKNKRIYGKIQKINPKRCKVDTEDGNTYDVPYSMLRRSDKNVAVPEKKTDDIENIKKNYKVGMRVRFKHKKKYVTGKIIKCNPKRARLSGPTRSQKKGHPKKQ